MIWLKQNTKILIPLKDIKSPVIYKHNTTKPVKVKKKSGCVTLSAADTNVCGLLTLVSAEEYFYFQVVKSETYDALIDGKSILQTNMAQMDKRNISDVVTSIVQKALDNHDTLTDAEYLKYAEKFMRQICSHVDNATKAAVQRLNEEIPNAQYFRNVTDTINTLNGSQLSLIANTIRTVIDTMFEIDGKTVKAYIPKLEDKINKVLSGATIDTCKHNSDMRGTDGAIRSLTPEMRKTILDNEAYNKLAEKIAERIAAHSQVLLGKAPYIVKEQNEQTGEPLSDVFVRACTDSNGNKPVTYAITDNEGRAVLWLNKHIKYWIYKDKPGWKFTVDELEIN